MLLPFVAELNRRRVFRALIVYGVIAFAVLQIIEPIMHGMHWPDAVLSYVIIGLALGFPVVVGLAWVFDVNAGHIERSPSPRDARLPGVKVALALISIGLLAAAPGIAWYFVWRGHATSPESKGRSMARPAASIAVLPFVDMSAEKDQEYLSDGIAEEIINSLAQVDDLRVIGRTSSFSFKGKNEDLRGIGERLGVANLVEGSVRKSGSKIRVTAQLVESAGGSHLWSQTYDRELADLFVVQDDIAASVVAALKLKLLASHLAGPTPERPSPEVYNQYLIGKQFVRQSVGNLSPDANRRAIDAFKRALVLDDRYAPAWAALSLAEDAFAQGYASTLAEWRDASERAVAAAEKAVALGPQLGDGYEARGWIRTSYKWDWDGARKDLEHAMTLNRGSSSILNHYGHLLWALGRLPESIAAVKKAIEVDPLDSESWWFLGVKLHAAGQSELARDAFKRSLEIAPDNGGASWGLAYVTLMEGRPDAALAAFERMSSEELRLWGVAVCEHVLGHERESQKALDALVEKPLLSFWIGRVYASRGERSRALDWLDRAYGEHSPDLLSIKLDPMLRSLHGDPRWNALLKQMNLPLD